MAVFFKTVCASIEVFLIVWLLSTSIYSLFKAFCLGVFHQISVLTSLLFQPPSSPPKKKNKKKLPNKMTGVNSSFGHIFEWACILFYSVSGLTNLDIVSDFFFPHSHYFLYTASDLTWTWPRTCSFFLTRSWTWVRLGNLIWLFFYSVSDLT